jgi:putative transposase
VELTDMRILAYTIMPNHWHLVLYPKKDTDMKDFMHWLTTTHVRQRRAKTKSIGHGHLYQGTYKSFPIEEDQHLTTVIRYVEQNPLRAKLVTRAEHWKWGSLVKRLRGNKEDKKLLAKLPTTLPANYLVSVNTILKNDDLEEIRHSIKKNAPFGSTLWIEEMVSAHDMLSTQRDGGRPKKGSY